MSNISPHDIADQDWDVIVVGTGMGGATLGYALAKNGKRVLFCEKGRSHLGVASSLLGGYAESSFGQAAVPQPQHRDILARAGRYAEQIDDRSAYHSRKFIPFIGSGTGGSSALYGMALERFFPCDFIPRHNHPDASETTLPEEWPIAFETLAPYYAAAEKLYRVRGTRDPLQANLSLDPILNPPPLTAASHELFDFFREQGLHPYRLPLACEYVADCECCQGYLCARNCKNDSAQICLQPAISQYGARLLDECNVLELEASRNEVTGLICSWQGKRIKLRAQTVVLGAGALETPAILLRSSSKLWPQGLANNSGMVGRNLMRHNIDLYLITLKSLKRSQLMDNRQKQLGFNDLYYANGKKLGAVQSFGRLPPAPLLAASLAHDFRHGKLPGAALLSTLVKPLAEPLLSRMVDRSTVLATIMEDLPYEDNFVAPCQPSPRTESPSLIVNYRLRPHEIQRIALFRTLMRNTLKPYKVSLIKQAENNERLAHVCGTCRFGEDPQKSVLDANNRAHDITNLYVVDSSFFPSSGGTNPSLTIAANALRVASHLTRTES